MQRYDSWLESCGRDFELHVAKSNPGCRCGEYPHTATFIQCRRYQAVGPLEYHNRGTVPTAPDVRLSSGVPIQAGDILGILLFFHISECTFTLPLFQTHSY